MNETRKPLIGLIHSTRLVVDPVHQVVASQCPDAEIIHIVDDLQMELFLGILNRRIPSVVGMELLRVVRRKPDQELV